MCNAGPKRRRSRPVGRRNLSAVAESIGLPEGYIVTKYERGEDGCDRAWVERREVKDRACPRCGCEGHVNGHYRSRVWHTPTHGSAQLCLMLHQVRLRCPRCGKCWSDGHVELLSEESRHMTAGLAEGIRMDLMLRKTWRSAAPPGDTAGT